jgi:hypothetical protein
MAPSEAAQVIRANQLIDQIELSRVPHRLDERADLALVELAHARHRGG